MTLISLSDCCRLLIIDPKTLRRWLDLAHVPFLAHPTDARIKGITASHLCQIATAHHRILADFPEAAPLPVQALQLQEPPPLSGKLLDVLHTLPELSAQIVVLQERLTELTQLLHPVPVSGSPSQEEPAAMVGEPAPVLAAVGAEPAPVPATPRSGSATFSSAKRLRAPVHVLPLVEYGTHGGYMIICPEHGLLTFQPDSTEWFAWLVTRSSFRFVGQSGRFTAHREFTRVPGCAWRAHRQIRNHTYNIRLGSTESLTIAALEQAAAELQSHLA
jgi:hypothetical protein